MSRRKNGTNRSGAMLGINIYTGKIQKKKKVATLTEVNDHIKNIYNVSISQKEE